LALFKSRNAAARNDGIDSAPDIAVQQETIGRVLRRTREENGLDLQQVSQVLRIRFFYLDAIEKGNFDRLPGPAYATGFIRTYANFLGIEPDSVIQGYKQERDRPSAEGNLTFPTPEQETRIPGAAFLLIGLLAAALAYGGWFYLRERPEGVLDLVPELPDRLARLLGRGEEGDASPANGVVMKLPSSPEAALNSADDDPPKAAEEPEEAPTSLAATTLEEAPDAAPAGDDVQAGESGTEAVTDVPLGGGEGPGEEPGAEMVSGEELPSEEEVAIDARSEDAEPIEPAPAESRISALSEAVGAAEAEPGPGAAIGLPGPQASPDDDLTSVLEDLPSPPAAAAGPLGEPAGESAAPSEGASFTEQVAATGAPTVPVLPSEAAGAPRPAAVIYGEENVEARVVLQAVQDSWVQVRDEDGELLLTRVLRPGDIYRAPDRAGLTLLTGNAGGLEIYVDGLKLPALGPVGAVRRNVSLNSDSLLGDLSGVE
jgi:cytoskeletal protein RodZ